MYLKSIEIQGFKSFANKQVFEFHKGITAIVGPNGSGKSNVADAMRWVLGEQSAKQLRGSKMEDVIFAGTQLRKPMGFAYVAITFDNEDRRLNLDYDTVKISRRVYRSGESEYMINGNQCRLKDIQELLFDTGIGKEGYSIISQGRIDQILSGKPEDRRELFDEAAGIVKYKKRRELTEKNIDEEKANLARIDDILYELESQLGPLEKQSEKAARYLSLRDELRNYDANIYLLSFDKVKKDAAQLEEKISINQSQLTQTQKESDEVKKAYAQLEEKAGALTDRIQSLQDEIHDLDVQQEHLRGREGQCAQRLESRRADIRRMDSEIDSFEELAAGKADEENEQKARGEEFEGKFREAENRRRETAAALENIRGSIAQLSKEIDACNTSVIDRMNEEAQVKVQLQKCETVREQAQKRRQELQEQLEMQRSAGEDEEEVLMDLKSQASEIALAVSRAKGQTVSIEAQAKRISEDTASSWDRYNQNDRRLNEEKARLTTLRNITERYEGYGYSIRKVMEYKKKRPGIIGVVADIIHVDKKYELAIETALGGSISNIVTDDERTARDMVEVLKAGRFGRATFLPLTSIRGRRLDNFDSRGCKGVIGLADTVVTCDDRFREVAAYLLGRVVVVDNIDNALQLARKTGYRYRIVTLEGEALSPGGSIAGGAYRNTQNLLGRSREIAELTESVRKYQSKAQQLRDHINQLQSDKQKNKEDAQKNAASLSDLKVRDNTVRMKIEQISKSRSAREDEIAQADEEIKGIDRQLKENEEQVQQLRGRLKAHTGKREENSRRADELGRQMEQLRSREKSLSEQDAQAQAQFAGIQQQRRFAQENAQRARQEQEKIRADIESRRQSRAEAAAEIGRIEQEQKEITHSMEETVRERDEKNSLYESAVQEKEQYTAENKKFFERREELSAELNALDKEQYRLNSQKEKLEESRSSLSSYMWDEYELTYESAKALAQDALQQMPYNKLQRHAADLKKEMRSLGDVNVNAVAQYKEQLERYEKMKTQHDDIVETQKKLESIIRGLNKSMTQRFSEQFVLIQQQFDRIFRSLFGGGKAALELADPDNLLETGVLINVQPPGKKLQNMMQLSGGEKALTAISLLFAIQSLNPSPFCLLDEIEAALDDANVKRFADYLRNLTDDTQFIVITHRRGTMNAADVLYGITMQEKGVSTLVSVNLIDSQLTN